MRKYFGFWIELQRSAILVKDRMKRSGMKQRCNSGRFEGIGNPSVQVFILI
jgi:hypothetical protein